MFARILRNIRFEVVLLHTQGGNFQKAEHYQRKLLARLPKSIAWNLYLADIFLFSERIEEAREQYQFAQTLMTMDGLPDGQKRQNRRYLRAYANFRILAIDHHLAGSTFSKWKAVAEAIDKVPAETVYKKIFALPGKPDVF